MVQSRTHTCGELRMEHVGQTVTLAGFLENVREVGQNFAFVVLRDFYGVTQVVIETEEMMAAVNGLNKESTIQVTGLVRERDSKNPKLPTGDIEVVPEAVEVLGRKAWELGVPKEAFAGIVHEFATRSAEAQRAADAAEAERVAAVKAELEGLWGDGYGAHVRSAVSALEMLAKMTGVSGEEVRAVVDDPVIGTNPVMIRLLAQMGAMMQDEPAKGLNMPGGAAAGGKAEAERMMNDPSHPLHEAFMNPNHANHRYADEQYNRLMGF